MTEFGYALSSEEHRPLDLARNARRAEESGFTFALISDHYHPWIDKQGQSSFVWSVIGAISQTTERLQLGTGVTCPLIRTHPAIIAQAAATAAALMPGRFFLGLGTGENLNEHILGDRWPAADERREMLTEAVEIIRDLWRGEMTDYHGAFYRVENARVYTLPDEPPSIYIAASSARTAELAGEIADGFIGTSPEKEVLDAYRASGEGPMCGQVTVCWAHDEASARKTAHEWWPTAGVHGELTQELPLPRHFEQASKNVTEGQVAQMIVCGPDPQKHIEQIRKYVDAGYTHVYVHQVGPDQEGFFRFYGREVLPQLRGPTEMRRSA